MFGRIGADDLHPEDLRAGPSPCGLPAIPYHAESFRDLLDADEAVLREIVAGGGDAPERVWAAWSLALRRDPAIAEVARSLPDGALDALLLRDIPAVDGRIAMLVRTGRVSLNVEWLLRLVLRWQVYPRAEWTRELERRADAMHDAVTELAKLLPRREQYDSPQERDLGERLRDALEHEAQRAVRDLDVSVGALVSYARGEISDAEFWGDRDDEDSWIDWPPGLRLLPDLQRLAAAAQRR